jgi:hypothetical protein
MQELIADHDLFCALKDEAELRLEKRRGILRRTAAPVDRDARNCRLFGSAAGMTRGQGAQKSQLFKHEMNIGASRPRSKVYSRLCAAF